MLVLFWAVVVTVLAWTHAHPKHGFACRQCGSKVGQLDHVLQSYPSPHLGKIVSPLVPGDGGINTTLLVTNDHHQDFHLVPFSRSLAKSTPSLLPQEDGSFFPGYAWRNVECPVCRHFLGWSFHRVDPTCAPHSSSSSSSTVFTHEEALKSLPCLSKAIDGYWTVEYCPHEIKQFHLKTAVLREPEYSLGKVESSVIVSSDGLELRQVVGVLGKRNVLRQYFSHGQFCDETHQPRQTMVTLLCCKDYHGSLGPVGQPFLLSAKESKLCEYIVMICVPNLCDVEGFQPQVLQGSPVSKKTKEALPVCTPAEESSNSFVALDFYRIISESSSELVWAQQPLVNET